MRFVPHNCRDSFTQRDFEFIASVLSDVSASSPEVVFHLACDPDMLNILLDDPKLTEAVLSMPKQVDISAELYFYVLVRHGLTEAGIDHRELADYVAATLAEFAKGNPFRTEAGDQLQIDGVPYHIDFIEAINSANAYDRFYLHVRCGNQFLVLTGLFPGFLAQREERRGAPGVQYYERVAETSYRTAGSHPLADEFSLVEVYDLLAERFGETRRALNRLANEYMWLSS